MNSMINFLIWFQCILSWDSHLMSICQCLIETGTLYVEKSSWNEELHNMTLYCCDIVIYLEGYVNW